MTDRGRQFADLGLEYSEGIERASVIILPSTGREVRRTPDGLWEVQPHRDNYWVKFEDLLDAVRCGTPPRTPATGTSESE